MEISFLLELFKWSVGCSLVPSVHIKIISSINRKRLMKVLELKGIYISSQSEPKIHRMVRISHL